MGSYKEWDSYMNHKDFLDATELLNLKEEAEYKSYKEAMKKRG